MCGSPGSCELQVQIANITQNYFVGGSPMTWTDQTLSFTPTGSTATLTFNSLNGGTGGPAIDNVRISGAVGIPEPASVCLGLLSAGLLVLARLRR